MILSTRWKKVIKDLFSNKTRTLLVVITIAVGVFAFGSVLITREVLLNDMDTQYAAANPAIIDMGFDSVDEGILRWMLKQPEVDQAQARATYSVKLLDKKDTKNLFIRGFNNFADIKINTLDKEAGKYPPQRGEIVLERSSLKLIDAQIGDSVEIELPNGRKRQVKIVGTVHDLTAIPANFFPWLSAYVDFDTLDQLGLPTENNQILIITNDSYTTLSQNEKVADVLKTRLEDRGIEAKQINIWDKGEHWGKDPTSAFVFILTTIGLVSLVLSGLLVVNTISAILTQQRNQIGIMKAIGGKQRQIFELYIFNVAIYGILALLLALPIGLILAFIYTKAVTNLLNVNILSFGIPLRIFLLEVILAIFIPVLFSFIPILSGVNITVIQALGSYRARKKRKKGLIDSMFTRITVLPRPLLISLRNTIRKKSRLLLTVTTLTLSGVLFIMVLNVRQALIQQRNRILTLRNYDFELNLKKNYDQNAIINRVQAMENVIKAEGQLTANTQIIKSDKSMGSEVQLIGLDPETDFVKPDMVNGRWLDKNDQNVVVLANSILDKNKELEIGRFLHFEIDNQKHKLQIIGSALVLGRNNSIAYVRLDDLQHISQQNGKISVLAVKTQAVNEDQEQEFTKQIESKLKRANFEVANTISTLTLKKASEGQSNFLIAFLLGMSALVAVVGGLGLAGTMSLNVIERTREIGVMRSIGASNLNLRSIILIEGIIVGLISWILALPISIPVSFGFGYAIGMAFAQTPLQFAYSWVAVMLWLGIILIISTTAALMPAQRAIKLSIRETIAYE